MDFLSLLGVPYHAPGIFFLGTEFLFKFILAYCANFASPAVNRVLFVMILAPQSCLHPFDALTPILAIQGHCLIRE